MNNYRSLNHTKWECQYHVVFIPKYRRKTLYGGLRHYLGDVLRRLAEQRESRVEEGLRWTPSFGPKSGVAKVEPAGSVLLVVLSCNRGWRPVPATRNCLTLAVEPTGTPASALMRR